ncbi:FaeA/PapI family transcriptional regulator [Escherichia marmotae]|jgi:predicted transcriptional regulator|uniref:FaeA/PapI family transcriptional regulator n=2 Tax=Enterobacteriaceae TaxID=543 RepID=UPI003A5C40E9
MQFNTKLINIVTKSMITNTCINIKWVIMGGITMREEIRAYMQIKKCCTTREVADAIGISVYQAQYYLAKLQEKGEIVRSEKRQGQRCIWTIK